MGSLVPQVYHRDLVGHITPAAPEMRGLSKALGVLYSTLEPEDTISPCPDRELQTGVQRDSSPEQVSMSLYFHPHPRWRLALEHRIMHLLISYLTSFCPFRLAEALSGGSCETNSQETSFSSAAPAGSREFSFFDNE